MREALSCLLKPPLFVRLDTFFVQASDVGQTTVFQDRLLYTHKRQAQRLFRVHCNSVVHKAATAIRHPHTRPPSVPISIQVLLDGKPDNLGQEINVQIM